MKRVIKEDRNPGRSTARGKCLVSTKKGKIRSKEKGKKRKEERVTREICSVGVNQKSEERYWRNSRLRRNRGPSGMRLENEFSKRKR
jgi:hypothetical protein